MQRKRLPEFPLNNNFLNLVIFSIDQGGSIFILTSLFVILFGVLKMIFFDRMDRMDRIIKDGT